VRLLRHARHPRGVLLTPEGLVISPDIRQPRRGAARVPAAVECLSESALFDFAAGAGEPQPRAAIESHLSHCDGCRASLAALVSHTARSPEPAPELERTRASATADLPLPRGAQIGRYLVLEHVGQGAMGVVYAAYDPKLDRRVALKLLRGELPEAPTDPRRVRFLQEAQVMARLSHPNVVAVHDVGTAGSRDFIAMEFVEGQSLRRWLQPGRRWREVLRVFAAAGEGLRAAHEAGLAHCDFKPDNVLLSRAGAVRVGDFGLARRADPAADSGAPLSSRAGTLVGTPAYMSPEQWAGEPPDARSDQFSFCVALYEALFGRRPFGGDSLQALREQVLRGEPAAAPDTGVPRRVRRALLRGLARRAEDRHPGMKALLDELGRDPAVEASRSLVATLALAALACGAGLAAQAAGLTRASERALADFAEARLTPRQAPRHVALVALDDRTLAQHAQTPLVLFGPLIARAVTHLREAGATVVALDLVFELSSDQWLAPLAGDAPAREFDQPLREALAGGGVLLAAAIDPDGTPRLPAPELLLSLPGGAHDLGYVNLVPDDDGVVRHIDASPVRDAPTLAAAAAQRLGAPAASGPQRLVFSGPPGTFPRTSLGAWIDGIPPDGRRLVEGRAVVLGALDSRTQDLFATPFSRWDSRASWMSGAELHANIIEQLASGRRRDELPAPAALGLLLALAALSALAAQRLPAGWALVAVALGLPALELAGFALAWRQALALDLVAALAVTFTAGALALALRLWAEQRARAPTLERTP